MMASGMTRQGGKGLVAAGKAALLALAVSVAPARSAAADPAPIAPAPAPIIYGSNPAAGGYFEHDGVRLYYEVYGQGQPLLLIHGNGSSIWWMKNQIADFSRRYQVIAMDSRDHGRSGDATGALTFEAMSDDLAALLDHLHTGPVLVLGWSDGAIEALLLGIRHPDKVTKIAAMAANLYPEGVEPDLLKVFGPAPSPGPAHTPTRAERIAALDRNEPHIKPDALEAITAPTLVLASDHDAILDAHTLEIYHHLPNSQLVIFPDATHMIPVDDPDRFDAVVDRFFRTPFVKKDRVQDLLKSFLRLKQEQAAQRPAAAN
jgi:pimeloyl-ACP methyl ester carboxylesterase